MVPDRLWCRTDCVAKGCHSHVPARSAARQSFSFLLGATGWGEKCMFMFDWSALTVWPPPPPRRPPWTACVHFVRRLSPQFQYSLSAAALGIYLYGVKPIKPVQQEVAWQASRPRVPSSFQSFLVSWSFFTPLSWILFAEIVTYRGHVNLIAVCLRKCLVFWPCIISPGWMVGDLNFSTCKI